MSTSTLLRFQRSSFHLKLSFHLKSSLPLIPIALTGYSYLLALCQSLFCDLLLAHCFDHTSSKEFIHTDLPLSEYQQWQHSGGTRLLNFSQPATRPLLLVGQRHTVSHRLGLCSCDVQSDRDSCSTTNRHLSSRCHRLPSWPSRLVSQQPS
jgi:hypothetical protein